MAVALANVTKSWKEFNLIVFQTELDQVATDLAERQDNSEQSRKRLIEQNKEFKKNSSAETKKQVAALLKSFQNEIDDLTNRSKAAESAFLNVYKRIVEAPDPVPSLEFVQSVQTKASKVADLELENGKLRETLSEYNKEFAEVKNQEVTIKQLREKVKELEESVDSRVSSKLVEKERELAKSYEEKNQLITSSQVDLEKRLTESEHNSHALQSAYNAAQADLFELRSRLDDEQSAKNSEMELVLGDLEVANQKLVAAEKEITDLHSQLSELKAVAAAHSEGQLSATSENEAIEEAFQRLASTSLEAELVAKERQIEQLVEENRKLNSSLTSNKNATDLQRQKHQQEYLALEQQIEAMKEKLDQQRDYAEIKRELNIMKSVEFGFSSATDESSVDDPATPKTSSSATPDLISGSVVTKQSLELLLLEKNKKLQNEATNLRNSNTALQGDLLSPSNVATTSTVSNCSLSINSPKSLLFKTLTDPALNEPAPGSAPNSDVLNLSSTFLCQSKISAAHSKSFSPCSIQLKHETTSSTDDSDSESLTCNSESSGRSAGFFGQSATPVELFNPVQIAEKVVTEIQAAGISVKALSRDLSLQNLRVLIEEPKSFNQLSQIEFYGYLDLLKWLREQEMAKEEQTKPKSDAETNEAIERILACARQEMDATKGQKSCDETEYVDTVEATAKDSDEPQSSKTEQSTKECAIDASGANPTEFPPKNFLRKCPKVPGSRLTVLAHMRRMLITPLTQGDVMKYANCDTQELAEKIRRILENNSISQRVFGHYVLGMSQSSVSDLLLHPKAWSATTGKGQASYIRMQKWLEDDTGVERLKQLNATFLSDVLTNVQQMSSSSTSSTNNLKESRPPKLKEAKKVEPPPVPLEKPVTIHKIPTVAKAKEIVLNIPKVTQPKILPRPPTVIKSEADIESLLLFNDQKRLQQQHQQPGPSSCAQISIKKSPLPFAVKMEQFSPAPVTTPQVVKLTEGIGKQLQVHAKSLPITTSCNAKSSKPRRSIKLTDEIFQSYSTYGIDTFRLTDQVKLLMSTRSIGQKVLGENILGLCQASVCDLLNKPRPWHGLHRRVKEAYIRLQIWANNPASFPLIDSYGEDLASIPPPSTSKASNEVRKSVSVQLAEEPPTKKPRVESNYVDKPVVYDKSQIASSIATSVETTIQKLASYVDNLSPNLEKSLLSEIDVTKMGDWNASRFEDRKIDDAKVEAAAADFVRSYLSTDDNDESGNRLLSALGLCDESSNEVDDLTSFELENSPNTVVVQPKSPDNFLGSLIHEEALNQDTADEIWNALPKLQSASSTHSSVLDDSVANSEEAFEVSKDELLSAPEMSSNNAVSIVVVKEDKNDPKRLARIAALENTLRNDSEPWNDQMEAINLISKMQSNLASTSQSDPWGDSPESDTI